MVAPIIDVNRRRRRRRHEHHLERRAPLEAGFGNGLQSRRSAVVVFWKFERLQRGAALKALLRQLHEARGCTGQVHDPQRGAVGKAPRTEPLDSVHEPNVAQRREAFKRLVWKRPGANVFVVVVVVHGVHILVMVLEVLPTVFITVGVVHELEAQVRRTL